jgi:hypothetical protein
MVFPSKKNDVFHNIYNPRSKISIACSIILFVLNPESYVSAVDLFFILYCTLCCVFMIHLPQLIYGYNLPDFILTVPVKEKP